MYTSNSYFKLIGYIDSDFPSCANDRKSTFEYVFNFGSGVVACASKKNLIVTLSSAKAEYVDVTIDTCQTMWMRRILSELLHEQEELTHIFYDNKSAIALSRIHFFNKKSKHIDTRYHFI